MNGATLDAIVNDRLSALELAITPDMGHDGWANDVTLSNILCLHHLFIYIRTQKYVWKHHTNAFETYFKIRPTSKLGYLSFKVIAEMIANLTISIKPWVSGL